MALVGDFGSGKTSLYKRMSTGCFSEEEDLEEEVVTAAKQFLQEAYNNVVNSQITSLTIMVLFL